MHGIVLVLTFSIVAASWRLQRRTSGAAATCTGGNEAAGLHNVEMKKERVETENEQGIGQGHKEPLEMKDSTGDVGLTRVGATTR